MSSFNFSSDLASASPFTDWEQRYSIRRFEHFAQAQSSLAMRRLTAISVSDFSGKGILFHNPLGRGKSSALSLLLRRRNCHKFEEHPTDPCGDCPGCRSRFTGPSYQDAGRRFSARDSDWLSTLTENIGMWSIWRPPKVNWKAQFVIGFDDAQFIPRASQQVVQELIDVYGGNGVLFILASTDTDPLLPSLLSRLEKLSLGSPTVAEIEQWLDRILTKEGVVVERQFSRWLAQRTSRCPRDILKVCGSMSRVSSEFTRELAEQFLQ